MISADMNPLFMSSINLGNLFILPQSVCWWWPFKSPEWEALSFNGFTTAEIHVAYSNCFTFGLFDHFQLHYWIVSRFYSLTIQYSFSCFTATFPFTFHRFIVSLIKICLIDFSKHRMYDLGFMIDIPFHFCGKFSKEIYLDCLNARC